MSADDTEAAESGDDSAHDRAQDGSSARDSAEIDATDQGVSIFDLDALDGLTDEDRARLAEDASKALAAFTYDSGETFREVLQAAVAPQLAENAKLISDTFIKSIRPTIDPRLFSAALRGFQAADITKHGLGTQELSKGLINTAGIAKAALAASGYSDKLVTSGILEAVSKSTAAFSITSGLRISDTLNSSIRQMLAETNGLGVKFGPEVTTALGITAKTIAAADLGLGLGKSTTPDFSQLAGTNIIEAINKGALGEIGRKRNLAMQQLVATSGIADAIGGDKILATWRQSLLAEATARSLIGTIAIPETSSAALLRDIVGTNAATARVVGRFADQNRASMLGPAASASATRALRTYLAGMPAFPDHDGLVLAGHASRAVAGLAAADLLVSDGILDEEASDLLEAEVVEPWFTGPEAARDRLFHRLERLDHHVPDLLRGAWTQVESNGPAATSLASHAVQEALDRTLRRIVTEEQVLRLHASGHLPNNAVYEKGGKLHATRTGRIAAALHERNPTQTKLVAQQAKALSNTVTFLSEQFQGGKHASSGTVGLVRTWLVSAEAILTQLTYEPGDG